MILLHTHTHTHTHTYTHTTSVKPVVVSISGYSEVNISLPFSLQCNATGFPSPSLYWLKNGSNVSTAITSTTTQPPDSLPQVWSVLNFTSLQRNDTANYTCVATNTMIATLNDSLTSRLVVLGELATGVCF